MAEYIDRKRVIKEINSWWRTAIMADGKPTLNAYIKALPSANVVEREKIDKAIEEIENQKKIIFECDGESDLGIAIRIIKKYLGEVEE